MDIKEYIALLEVHPTACNQKEIERLTVVESPDQVHARMLRIADRIRGMVCEAEGGMLAGRDTANITARINNLIKVILDGNQ